MRGIPFDRAETVPIYGITPAHAGNTQASNCIIIIGWDHPRTCGEYTRRLSKWILKQGSPPHMRGIRVFAKDDTGNERITPAHAGNTSKYLKLNSEYQDHPRTCGEYRLPVSGESWPSGSPPHMRGIQPSGKTYTQDDRITPAHAGNTRQVSQPSLIAWDHPRTCGEY